MCVLLHIQSEYQYCRYVRDIERNRVFHMCLLMYYLYFLSGLVFSVHQMKRRHKEVMVTVQMLSLDCLLFLFLVMFLA